MRTTIVVAPLSAILAVVACPAAVAADPLNPPGASTVLFWNGYVCETVYYPNAFPTNQGNYGVVDIDVSSGQNCNGTVTIADACTVGATASSCQRDELYDESQLLALEGWAVTAETTQTYVSLEFDNGFYGLRFVR